MQTDHDSLELFLAERIFPELERGRPDWDKPHTQAVVHYLKEILRNTPDISVDAAALLIAAYAHDWGYSGLFNAGKPRNLDDILRMKALHMELGVQKITGLLTDSFFSFLTVMQKQRIIHLVGVHDKLSQITDLDEHILVEADTLGGLDTDRVTPFADKKSSEQYIQGVRHKRMPLFITLYGKSKLQELLHKRETYDDQKR